MQNYGLCACLVSLEEIGCIFWDFIAVSRQTTSSGEDSNRNVLIGLVCRMSFLPLGMLMEALH